MNYILNESGESVLEPDILRWSRWFEDNHQQRVLRFTQIGDVDVSTVFLGIDHGHGRVGEPPVLCETMVFGVAHDQYQERYTSRDEALAGHARTVALVAGNRKEDHHG